MDGLHFLLSIGNELEVDKNIEEDFKVDYITKESTTEEFIYIIQLTVSFSNHKTYNNYYSLLNRYLALSHILGFTEEEIFRAYNSKNKINHKRQDQGY